MFGINLHQYRRVSLFGSLKKYLQRFERRFWSRTETGENITYAGLDLPFRPVGKTAQHFVEILAPKRLWKPLIHPLARGAIEEDVLGTGIRR
jgi:hypothetical protein